MKKKKETKLGKYLFSLRIQRGFVNISDYLRRFVLPISDAYYRDLESGAKQISVEKSFVLCKALEADSRTFYYHLLNDLLPRDIITTLVRPIADETFSSLEERQALLEHDKAIYREALAKSFSEESYVLTDDAVRMLIARPDWMSILHFLYATESASATELGVVLRKNSITDPAHVVARTFEALGMAITEGDVNKNNNWSIRRRTIISRTPFTEEGKKLKFDFALREVKKSLQQKPFERNWAGGGSFIDSAILELSPLSVEAIRGRILDAIAEAHSAHEPISGGNSTPYFLGIFFGSRSEYTAANDSPESLR